VEPEAKAETQDLVPGGPDRQDLAQVLPEDVPQDLPQDLRAAEQLAAVAPETPVQSDTSATPAGTEQSATEQAGTTAEDRAVAELPKQPAETAQSPAPAPATTTEPAQTIEPEAVEPEAGDSEPAAQNAAPAPEPKPEPPAETQIAAAAPAGGDYVIQFASFQNPETAVREQGLVEERFSDLLAGHEIFVQQVDIADQGTFYRVRLGPFASLAEARATCARFQERERDCLAMAR